jgi:hypothetical protein
MVPFVLIPIEEYKLKTFPPTIAFFWREKHQVQSATVGGGSCFIVHHRVRLT